MSTSSMLNQYDITVYKNKKKEKTPQKPQEESNVLNYLT